MPRRTEEEREEILSYSKAGALRTWDVLVFLVCIAAKDGNHLKISCKTAGSVWLRGSRSMDWGLGIAASGLKVERVML